MNHYAVAGFLTLVTNAILAVTVLSKGLYSRVNKFFALSSIAVALYGLGFFLQAISTSRLQSLLAIKVNLLGTIFIPIFFLQMVYAILGKKLSKRMLWGLYGLGFTLEGLNLFSGLLAYDPIPRLGFKYLFQAGVLYPFLALFFLSCMSIILWNLYWGYRREKIGLKRNQLKYFFLGGLIGVVGGFPGFALGYTSNFYPLNPFAAYGVPIYSGICAYAILKYGLLGIRGTMRVVFAPLASMVIVGYAAVFSYDRMAFEIKELFSPATVLAYTISSIIFFQIVYKMIDFLMHKFFPIKKYEDLLYEYAKTLGRCTAINDIFSKAIKVLRDEDAPATASAVILWKTSPGHPFIVRGSFGVDKIGEAKLFHDSALVNMINNDLMERMDVAKKLPVLIKAELNKICSDKMIKSLSPEMSKFNGEICIPLIYREGLNRHLMGFLMLGEPIASDVYTGWDYDFFREVADQTMLTLINGEARERVGKMERLAYLGNMAMGWGHQLNNILFRISLRGRMITENLGSGIDRSHLSQDEDMAVNTAINDADCLIKAALQGGEVAKDFLRLTKTLKRRDIERVNLHERVDAAINDLQDRGRIGGVKVFNRIPLDLVKVEGIGYCFEEVFKNLIDNAARAVMEERGEGKGWIDISVEVPEDGGNVVIMLKDNGCGMSPEDVTNLGTPLFSVVGKEADGGRHGLGVSVIYYYIMNIHNGDIRVESEIGEGTTFYITVPIKQEVSEGDEGKVLGAKANRINGFSDPSNGGG